MDFAGSVDFFAPSVCFDDAYRYVPELLNKRGIAPEPALEVLDILKRIVQPIETEWLETFEAQARFRLKQRDEQDWPILATALALNCPIWTENADFFGVGAATWTTANIEYHLSE